MTFKTVPPYRICDFTITEILQGEFIDLLRHALHVIGPASIDLRCNKNRTMKKILLVDDDEAAVYITKRLFKKAAIEADMLIARHGQEALDIVRIACQQEECPELILLDIHMPVMNGFEFLEHLQASVNLSTAPIKIVLLSSSTHYLDIARAKQYPVFDYIEKPLTIEKLSKYL